jgi:regulator of PEP synthase PpsR (kinase-PPPase family)
VIDVTRRSIEETAATILKLMHERSPARDEDKANG